MVLLAFSSVLFFVPFLSLPNIRKWFVPLDGRFFFRCICAYTFGLSVFWIFFVLFFFPCILRWLLFYVWSFIKLNVICLLKKKWREYYVMNETVQELSKYNSIWDAFNFVRKKFLFTIVIWHSEYSEDLKSISNEYTIFVRNFFHLLLPYSCKI